MITAEWYSNHRSSTDQFPLFAWLPIRRKSRDDKNISSHPHWCLLLLLFAALTNHLYHTCPAPSIPGGRQNSHLMHCIWCRLTRKSAGGSAAAIPILKSSNHLRVRISGGHHRIKGHCHPLCCQPPTNDNKIQEYHLNVLLIFTESPSALLLMDLSSVSNLLYDMQ